MPSFLNHGLYLRLSLEDIENFRRLERYCDDYTNASSKRLVYMYVCVVLKLFYFGWVFVFMLFVFRIQVTEVYSKFSVRLLFIYILSKFKKFKLKINNRKVHLLWYFIYCYAIVLNTFVVRVEKASLFYARNHVMH